MVPIKRTFRTNELSQFSKLDGNSLRRLTNCEALLRHLDHWHFPEQTRAPNEAANFEATKGRTTGPSRRGAQAPISAAESRTRPKRWTKTAEEDGGNAWRGVFSPALTLFLEAPSCEERLREKQGCARRRRRSRWRSPGDQVAAAIAAATCHEVASRPR